MTVIAWDGKTLAADKAATDCGLQRTATKIFRIEQGFVAFAGAGNVCRTILAWMKDGMVVKDFPTEAKDGSADVILIRPDGVVLSYGNCPHPYAIEDKFFAMGTGRDYAMAAMYFGKSAREAVECAIRFDTMCGCGIDTLELA